MAWPGSLTAAEQQAVQDFTTNLRSWAAALARLNALGSAIGAAWFGGVQTLVDSLQAGDTIPNASGLAGSQDLSKADVDSLASWAWTLSNPDNPTQGTGAMASVGIQQTCVKAAGINASIG